MANIKKTESKEEEIKKEKIDKTESELEEVKDVKDEVVESTPIIQKVEKATKQRREINLNDNVLIMNNVVGTLVMKSDSTNRKWIVSGYGKLARMQVQDIIDLCGTQSYIFEQGWAVVLDEDVVDYMGWTELYKNIIDSKNMDKFLELPISKIESLLKNASSSTRLTVAQLIKQKIKANQFNRNIGDTLAFEKALGYKLIDNE